MMHPGYNKQGVQTYMTIRDHTNINEGFHPLPKVQQYARRSNSCQDEARPTMLRFHNSVKKQFQLYNAIKLPICLYEEARIVWSLEHEPNELTHPEHGHNSRRLEHAHTLIRKTLMPIRSGSRPQPEFPKSSRIGIDFY